MSVELESTDIKARISERYGARARAVLENGTSSCCGSHTSCCGSTPTGVNVFSEGLYSVGELDGMPLQAVLATLGCANPVALSELHPGEIVLDIGSGGGLDVILSARRVGPTGHSYGLDMTDEMLQLAWHNALDAKVGNVTFMKGDVEAMPIPDNSIDVVLSNCVINLSTNKDRAFAEIHRVLKPGGRLAIADVVVRGGLPENSPVVDLMLRDPAAWGNCVAGALSDAEYETKLVAAGFIDTELQVLRTHQTAELLGACLPTWCCEFSRAELDAVMCRFTSSLVRAQKPAIPSDRDGRHG